MTVQFSLEIQNKELAKELHGAIKEVIDRGIFILGPKVSELEEKIADYIGVKYAVGVASGTDALTLGLLSLGVADGDEVIMPANSYPTAFGVIATGALPKLVDIDPATFTMDPKSLEKSITSKTKVIVVVHLYGQGADMESIARIGRKYKIPVVEDCAQAIGAEVKMQQCNNATMQQWKMVGSIGDIGCFSFYPTKNLGCFGDGGMVTTDNEEVYKRLKLYRMYGEEQRYKSVLLGKNSRLDELQAAILLVKLKYLDKWNDRRRQIAKIYKSEIQNPKFQTNPKSQIQNLNNNTNNPQLITHNLQLPFEASYAKHIFHLFVIRAKRRDELKAYLAKQGVQTAIHYPTPIHLEPSYKFLGNKKGDFPASEKASREILSLPMYPELKDGEIEKIVKIILNFISI